MGKVVSFETRPYYAQVSLFDPTVKGAYPDWGTGEDDAVASRSGVAVATRPDHLGPVAVEVWMGAMASEVDLRMVLACDLTVEGERGLVAGSVTGNDLHAVAVPAGKHKVHVFVNRERGEVDCVYFVVDPEGVTG